MKQIVVLALTATLCTSMSATPPQAQGTTADRGTRKSATARKRATASTSAAATSSVTVELQQMKAALDSQQRQIEQLRKDLANKDQAIQQAQQQAQQAEQLARDAQGRAETVASTASNNDQTVSALKSDVADIKLNATNNAVTMQEAQKAIRESGETPATIHYKGISITPGGFLAAETVYRQRAEAAGINTQFNGIPFPGAGSAHTSEFFATGRQSRISLLGQGKIKNATVGGYFEGDFLSAGVTSNNNQSNSYTFRQRQVWAQAALNDGLTFTGGQMWSLLAETRRGLDPRTEALPMTIDPQYTAGFTWARQFGFRVTKDIANAHRVWVGVSVENPQTTLTAHGNANNFVIGAAGNTGGLFNNGANYSFNKAPDVVVKAAFEPGFGHYEIFAIASQFRARIYPNATASTPSAAGAFNDSKTGGGIGANARVSVAKKRVDVGVHVFGGNGVGRYGTTGLPDATVHPDGTLALLRSYQALGTLEYHVPKIDIYANAGGEYIGRNWSLNSAGKAVGYGSQLFPNTSCLIEAVPAGGNGFTPGTPSGTSCTGDTRNIIEGSFGFWFKPYNGDRGRIQFGPQYSYVVRNTWRGVGGEPHAIENMFFTSFRYYLP